MPEEEPAQVPYVDSFSAKQFKQAFNRAGHAFDDFVFFEADFVFDFSEELLQFRLADFANVELLGFGFRICGRAG